MPTPTLVSFFSPTDILGLGGSFVPQSNAPSASKKRAQGLLENGDEGISKTHGGETKLVSVYEYQSEAGNIALPKIGSILTSRHIDSIDVEYTPTGWPKITVNSHQHDANPHTAANEFTSCVVLPAQFGVPRTLLDTTPTTPVVIFALGADDAGIGIKSLKYSFGCTHLDEDDEVGDHLAGDNRDGVEKIDVSMTGIPAAVTIGAGWDKLASGNANANTAADTDSFSLEHHVARDVEA